MSGSDERDPNLTEEELERLENEHYAKVVRSFQFYREHALERLQRAAASFASMSPRHKALVPGFYEKINTMVRGIHANADVIDQIIMCNSYSPRMPREEVLMSLARPAEFDMDKVYTTIKQFVRDWAVEGKEERDQCYKPILDKVDSIYPPDKRKSVSVCVPGSGLGRLAFEFAFRGYRCQGNEWSVPMLLASNFILNGRGGTHHTTLYPWLHIFTNNFLTQNQLRSVTVPDVNTYALPVGADFSMAAGDFLEVYNRQDEWDCVVTCFFLDTARNAIIYIENIWRMLKPGGYWINLGPLLYHFDDNRGASSFEPSFEEIRHIITETGFDILEERYPIESGYISDPRSMLGMTYKSVFFCAQKPNVPSEPQQDDDTDNVCQPAEPAGTADNQAGMQAGTQAGMQAGMQGATGDRVDAQTR